MPNQTERTASLQPTRDPAMLAMLSLQGLKAVEIADLHFEYVLAADGSVAPVMRVVHRISNGVDRTVPMHPRAAALLGDLVDRTPPAERTGPVFRNKRGEPMSANAVSQFFRRIYLGAGAAGVTSHTGRRAFILETARETNGCLRRVQMLAGYRSIASTESYLETGRKHWRTHARRGSIS